ncbi:metallophosphoesterase [Oscillatoriales cyanobacterium LEGE 11467]|uniref:Metallophosphoesterase n=1 Tax=Zarconia navalis LEGE 11467 TaxID=1828826 RepID=A0A928VZR3_9CYAN|nr:metallophosphoesterase [Zarconia navalis]MBE9042243.1 metallophosphoesterase [Zarconia navalis LEGE 11467]
MGTLNFKFAIVSDLHIALPHTIWNHPKRFHLVEVGIPALELILERLSGLDLDFLLLPGDLTQHGEPENHAWLGKRLAQLPYPTYTIPGNHDVPSLLANDTSIAWADFPHYYHHCGYENPEKLYYTREILPGVRLIALNSNQFDEAGKQQGCLDEEQFGWLETVLAEAEEELLLVMVHHNVIEHVPGQSRSPMGRRYMLDNAPRLLSMLRSARVQLVFTGHLHAQDIAYDRGIYDITTGSLVSYPHPYRVLEFRTDSGGQSWLQIESGRVESLPDWPELNQVSREWMGDRSHPFMMRLLTEAPLNLSLEEAEPLVPSLRYFWANIANGDAQFEFPHFPPTARRFIESFSATDGEGNLAAIDNHVTLKLSRQPSRIKSKI